jgi:hypothetical protein
MSKKLFMVSTLKTEDLNKAILIKIRELLDLLLAVHLHLTTFCVESSQRSHFQLTNRLQVYHILGIKTE